MENWSIDTYLYHVPLRIEKARYYYPLLNLLINYYHTRTLRVL